jgi:hypothetical protein
VFPFLTPVPLDIGQTAGVVLKAEERARAGNDVNAIETELAPTGRYDLLWDGGQNHFVALLAPRVIGTYVTKTATIDPAIVNPESIADRDIFERPNKNPVAALANGGFVLELNRPRYRVTLNQFAAYGSITTTALLQNLPWPGEGRPADPNPIIPSTTGARLTLLFAQTQFGVPIRVSRRFAVTPFAEFNAFGGADDASRGVIALTTGPGGGIRLEAAPSRYDQLETVVGGGRIETTFQGDRQGAVIYRALGTQSYRRWLSNRMSWQLTGGGTVGGDEINGYTFYTLADTALLYDTWGVPKIAPGAQPYGAFGGKNPRTQLGLVAKVEPWLDIFSGDLEQRAVGIGVANYSVGRVTVRGQIAAARVFGTPQSVATYETLQGETSLQYRFTRTFAADFGGRLQYQSFTNAVRISTIRQVAGFLTLTYSPLPARL